MHLPTALSSWKFWPLRASGAQIVINTTPAGMYPNVGVCNLDVAAMPGLEAVVDVVYNPDKTELILRARSRGSGGRRRSGMLAFGPCMRPEYFLDRKFEDAPAEIRRIWRPCAGTR